MGEPKKATRPRVRVMYMHTINRKPATYEPGYQIHFAGQGRYARKGVRLVASIAEIRREQAASKAWRENKGYDSDYFEYGYVRVDVPSVSHSGRVSHG